MIKHFEDIIKQTTVGLKCSAEEKREIELELADHLYSAYEYYLADGWREKEAIWQVLDDFGHTAEVSEQFQHVVSPLYGWLKKIAWLGFIVYSFFVVWELFTSRIIQRLVDYFRAEEPYYLHYVYSNAVEPDRFFDFTMWQYNLNLEPFKTIIFYGFEQQVNTDIAVHNLLGNIILMLPLGLLLPFLFYRCKSFVTVAVIACCVSFVMECLQFGLQIGMADIDDVLLNTFGAMIGYSIARGIFELLSWRLRFTSFTHLE